MPLTADVAAQQVQERLRSLHRLVYDIEAERARNEQCIDSILRFEKAGDSPQSAEDSSGSSQQQAQLKNLYKSGLSAAEEEERLLRAALSRIYDIRTIKNERRIQARHAGNKETIGCGALMKMLLSAAQTLPLHVGRVGERAPQLCGAVPADAGHVARAGDAVAALVRVSEKEENWILAEVVSWLPAQGKYEVDDIDEEQKNRHVLSKRRVVPLPLMRADPRTDEHALFPKGAVVMALYPQTTCFYRAVVNRLPASAADPYEVLFEVSETVQINLGIKQNLSVTTQLISSSDQLNKESTNIKSIKQEVNEIEENKHAEDIEFISFNGHSDKESTEMPVKKEFSEVEVLITPVDNIETDDMLMESKQSTLLAFNHSSNDASAHLSVEEELNEVDPSTFVEIELGEKKSEHSQTKENILTNNTMNINDLVKPTVVRRYACNQCDKAYTCSINLQNHLRVHTGEKPFICGECNKAFSRSGHLQTHMKIHTGVKPYTCNQCGKSFFEMGNLQRHLRVHTGVKTLACPQCDKTFYESGGLQRHIRVHTGEKAYACTQCDKKYSTSHGLKNHMSVHTGVKPYNCNQCNKSFTSSSNLQSHIRIHSGVRPYACNQCDKSFTESGGLRKHLRVHTGVKLYACNLCDKSYACSANLQNHMRIHTGDNPYVCKQCNKSFSSNGNLQTHLKTHTGIKPYICYECNKSFTTSSNLQSHLRIHTGEKPFACKECKKSFTEGGALQKHLRVHTGEKPYACTQCHKAYSTSHGLKKHKRIHTGEPTSKIIEIEISEFVTDDSESS